MQYRILHCSDAPPLEAAWESPAWDAAETLTVGHFRPESSSHRPDVRARLLWDSQAIHGIFRVHDRYVRCTHSNYFDPVWKDSCVEFFVKPRSDKGYFNFEFNCGGALLCYYITDHRRGPELFAEAVKLPPDVGLQVKVRSTLPPIIDPEITEPVVWTLQFRIPLRILEPYIGELGTVAGQVWRGNLFKCAEEVSHPHWAAWSPVDELNFHLPHCFGELLLVPPH